MNFSLFAIQQVSIKPVFGRSLRQHMYESEEARNLVFRELVGVRADMAVGGPHVVTVNEHGGGFQERRASPAWICQESSR